MTAPGPIGCAPERPSLEALSRLVGETVTLVAAPTGRRTRAR